MRHSRRLLLASVLVAAAAAPTPAGTGEVRFALTVEPSLLQAALRRHLRAEAAGQLVLWRSADGCRWAAMREPAVEVGGGGLRIAGPTTAEAGFGLLGYCFASVSWHGVVEVAVQPDIGPDWQLRLHVRDVQLYDEGRRRSGVAPRVWEAVRAWTDAVLPTFTVDLGPPAREVRELLGLLGTPARGAALADALRSLRPLSASVEPEGVKVLVALDLPSTPPAPSAPEPPLTPEAIRRWEARLDRWDGFLTFVVKDLGTTLGSPALRDELLDLLLTARHDLVAVLGQGPGSGPDPVRRLFLAVWSRLRALVREAGARAADEARGLRYLTFLAAGDALAALTAAAPALELELSADGLRRLARILDPAATVDPLDAPEGPDPTLRQLFRFRDPDAPPRRQRPPAPRGWWWPGPREAGAADPDEWVRLGQRLDRWTPEREQLRAYRETVERLLTLAAERTFDPGEAGPRLERLFDALVKATAWQESCWRQFVRKDGAVTYLVSPAGAVGLMQVVPRVWRGFFHPERLRWSAAYNAGAGAEILYHLLTRYGIREATERLDNAARATYAAYHGGPARYRRYRLARVSPEVRAIDRGFWQKYQLVVEGRAGDRVLCLPPALLSARPAGDRPA